MPSPAVPLGHGSRVGVSTTTGIRIERHVRSTLYAKRPHIVATSRDQPPEEQQRLQGVLVNVKEDRIQVQMVPERAQRIVVALKEHMMQDYMHPNGAASLAGKIQFATRPCSDRQPTEITSAPVPAQQQVATRGEAQVRDQFPHLPVR